MPLSKFFISIFFTMLLYTSTYAQVQIAPVAIYMDKENKTGRIVVRNSSDTAVEVNVNIHFGYPATNDSGEIYLKVMEEIPASEPSAAEWIRVYPRQIILPPGVQQTIRFAARPPVDLPDGEYWVRPAIISKPLVAEQNRISDQITTNINTIKRTFLSLNYRNGNVKTGVLISDLTTKISNELLEVEVKLEREGNAAYLGHMNLQIYSSAGKMVKQIKKEIAVYNTLNPIEEFTIEDFPKGIYSVKVLLNTSSRAETNENIIQAPRVSKEAVFEVK